MSYRRWLSNLAFEHPAQQIVFQDYVDAVGDAERRLKRVEGQILTLLSDWSLSPIVDALQALRGIAVINAVVLVAEVGDFTRFTNPRQLMAYFGLVPGERSSGQAVHRGGITKTGNSHARRALVEGAWAYRMKARVGRHKVDRIEALPKVIRDVAWKAQLRLLRPLSQAQGAWQDCECRQRCDRPRDGGLRLVDRLYNPVRAEDSLNEHLVTREERRSRKHTSPRRGYVAPGAGQCRGALVTSMSGLTLDF
jgi:Transposase IS116/IS110/IS902 family